MKENRPVVIGETQAETSDVFNRIASERGCEILYADRHYSIAYALQNLDTTVRYSFTNCFHWNFQDIDTDLQGTYQQSNITTSLMALAILDKLGFQLPPEAVRAGMLRVKQSTGLLGRWQEAGHNPLVVCDIAHNTAGIRQILKQIENTPYRQLHMVLGFVSDKKVDEIVGLLPKDALFYLCEPNIPRAMNVKELSSGFAQKNLAYKAFDHVKDAYRSAKESAFENDLIYIGGSTFVVADFLHRAT